MRLAGFAVALGLLAGLVGGGSFRHLRKFALRSMGLGVAWVLGSLVATRLDGVAAVVVLLAATVCGIVFAGMNALRWPGLAAVSFGLSLNALVLGLNGALPYDPAAAEAARLVPSGPVVLKTDGLTRPFRDGDQLLIAARRIPIAPLRAVTSVGDLLLAFGLGLAAFTAVIDRGKARPHRGRHRVGDVRGSSERSGTVTFGAEEIAPRVNPMDVALQVADVATDPVVLVDLTAADPDDPHLASELTARAAVRAVLTRHGLPQLGNPVACAGDLPAEAEAGGSEVRAIADQSAEQAEVGRLTL
jgi:hypothetical protein